MAKIRDYTVSSFTLTEGEGPNGLEYSFNPPGASFHKVTPDGRGYVNSEFDLNPVAREALAGMKADGVEWLTYRKALTPEMVKAIAAVPASVRAEDAARACGVQVKRTVTYGAQAATPVLVETVSTQDGPITIAQANARVSLTGDFLTCRVRVARMIEALDARDAAGKPAQRVKVSAWIAAAPPAGGVVPVKDEFEP